MFHCLLSTSQKKESGGAATVTGARNGLKLSGTFVELGGLFAAPAPMLHDSAINLAGFDVRFSRGLSEFNIDGRAAAGAFVDTQFDPTDSPGIPGVRLYGSSGGALINQVETIDSGGGTSARYNVVTGFFGDEGIDIGAFGDGHAVDPSVAFINSKGSAEMRIATGAGNIYNAFISFGIEDVEKMRLDVGGELMINRTSSINPLFKLQVRGQVDGYCTNFESNGPAALGLRQWNTSIHAFVGVPASGLPDIIFSDNTLNEAARIFYNGSGVSVPATNPGGYGFGGNTGDVMGMNAGGANLNIQSGAAGSINLNKGGAVGYYGIFDNVSGDLIMTTGGIRNTGGGVAWKFGAHVAGAAVLDAANYLTVNVGGVAYKIALVV